MLRAAPPSTGRAARGARSVCVGLVAVMLNQACGDGAPIYGGGDGLQIELLDPVGDLEGPAFEGRLEVRGAGAAELRGGDSALAAGVLIETVDPLLLRVASVGQGSVSGAGLGDAAVVLTGYEDWFDGIGRLPQAVQLQDDASLHLLVGAQRWLGAWEESGAALVVSDDGLEGTASGRMRLFPADGVEPSRTQQVEVRWSFDQSVSVRERVD